MKLFDPRAALAEIEKRGHPPATSATSATQPPENGPHVAKVADVAAPQVEIPKIGNVGDATPYRHGKAVSGNPKTWTGKIVSLDEWRRLSGWDRHGPDGQHWCGLCRKWMPADHRHNGEPL